MKNNLEVLKKTISSSKFKKILVITGKKSYTLSGAKKLIEPILKKSNYSFFYKKIIFLLSVNLKKLY